MPSIQYHYGPTSQSYYNVLNLVLSGISSILALSVNTQEVLKKF